MESSMPWHSCIGIPLENRNGKRGHTCINQTAFLFPLDIALYTAAPSEDIYSGSLVGGVFSLNVSLHLNTSVSTAKSQLRLASSSSSSFHRIIKFFTNTYMAPKVNHLPISSASWRKLPVIDVCNLSIFWDRNKVALKAYIYTYSYTKKSVIRWDLWLVCAWFDKNGFQMNC